MIRTQYVHPLESSLSPSLWRFGEYDELNQTWVSNSSIGSRVDNEGLHYFNDMDSQVILSWDVASIKSESFLYIERVQSSVEVTTARLGSRTCFRSTAMYATAGALLANISTTHT